MREDVLKKLEKIENLATIPGNAFQIIQLINNPDSSLKQISLLIEKDVPLTTKILKIANSPFVGFASEVATIQRALTILGLNQVKNLVLAIALYSAFVDFKSTAHFNREKFWQHSFGTGQIARTFSQKLKMQFMGEEFVSGVIHDIGKIILDQYFPEEFEAIYDCSISNKVSVLDAETQVLGANHMELGAWVLEKWKFPAKLIDVVRFHHQPEMATENMELISVIQISEVLCELWGIGFDDDIGECVIGDLSGWKVLEEKNPQLKNLDIEVMTMELYQDVSKAEDFFNIAKS